jgi:Fungal chitosanase of glycosyl hydrolase group 75
VTDREHAILLRIQFLAHRLEHGSFNAPSRLAAWRAELEANVADLAAARRNLASVATVINHDDSAAWWSSGAAVDADGAPNAYAPKGSGLPHLDDLDNAGSDGDWYGVVTANGRPNGDPVVQGPNGPFPGNYVSATALQDPSYGPADPRRYVDSTKISYFSIPENAHRDFGITKGDVGLAYDTRTGCMTAGVVADIGPKNKWGELSVKAASNLRLPTSAINGGADSGVVFVVFKGSSRGWPRTNEDVAQQAQDLLNSTGDPAKYGIR